MACEYYRNNIKSNDGTSIFGSGKLSLSLLSFFLSTFFCAKMEIICARRIPPGSRSTEVPTAEEEEIKSCAMRSRTIKNLWPNGRDGESTQIWPFKFLLLAYRFALRKNEEILTLIWPLPLENASVKAHGSLARQIFVSMANAVQGVSCLFCFELIKSARHAFHFHLKQVAQFLVAFVRKK